MEALGGLVEAFLAGALRVLRALRVFLVLVEGLGVLVEARGVLTGLVEALGVFMGLIEALGRPAGALRVLMVLLEALGVLIGLE